jgi:hypothetical protein
MLQGAKLPPKFWEYAFCFFLHIHVILPNDKSALPTTHRDGKATTSNIIQGTLLDYGGSINNFAYVNDKTGKIGRAAHATFDEAPLSSPVADLSLNSVALWGALHCAPASNAPTMGNFLNPPDQCCVFSAMSTFLAIATVVIPVCCIIDPLGLVFETEPMSYRNNIIVDITQYSSASHIELQHSLTFFISRL